MQLRIDHAQPDDAPIIAQMVRGLFREIMAMVGTSVFGFYQEETEAWARSWMADGKYSVLLARDADQGEPLGFLALYAEGSFGTIPELFVRPAYRSNGVGAALLSEAKRMGQAKGWCRLEVTTPPLPQFDRTLAFISNRDSVSPADGS
jgi:GNAT superfamily N-acetyltransferase